MAAISEINGNGNGQPGAAAFEKVVWKINQPVEGELKFDTGKPVSSQYDGDQVRYTLADDRVMYVPPTVAAEMERLRIERGVPFRITKRAIAAGNRKGTTWVVERIDGWEPQAEEARPAVQAPSPAPVASMSNAPSAPANQQQDTSRVAAAVAGAESVSQILAAAFARLGVATIEAVADVEGKAKDLGMDGFQFGAENVQKLWVTLFIAFKDATVSGGRR